jgi:hypothetical protein
MSSGGNVEGTEGGEADQSMLSMYRDSLKKPIKYCFLKRGRKEGIKEI